MAENDLESILQNQSEAEETTEQLEETEQAAEAETEAEDTGEQADDGEQTETQQDAPPASQEEQRQVPYEALREERRKRQELEDRLRAFEQRMQGQNQQQGEEKPDWWDDPEKAASTLQQQFQQQLINERFNMSETVARQQFGSEVVDQDIEAFKELVESRPHLAQELRNSSHPYQFVHDTVQREQIAQKAQNPEELLKEWLSDPKYAETAKQLLGMNQQQPVKQQKSQKASPPPSLANETSAMGRSSEGPPVNPSLDSILNG
jgi:hypothetical protein